MSVPESQPPTLSVVTVTYRQGDQVRPLLAALADQLREGDELIVVDNASGDDTAEVVADTAPDATLIRHPENSGFPAACNLGAERARGDLLVFLNPDSVPAAGWRGAIAAPHTNGSDWHAWQALVTAQGGTVVNTRGGVVHFTAIAWAGGAGEPVPAGTADGETGFASGACLAIGRERFAALGGFSPEFFLYHEDVDLSLRVRLTGGTVGVAAAARVDHDYDFDKGAAKWRHLERNRWATILRTYPLALLALVAPALLVTELALVPAAIVGGWWLQKLGAWRDVIGSLPRLVRERRAIQRERVVSAARFAAALTPQLDSTYLGVASRSRVLGAALRGYWRVVVALLGRPRS